jgi:hypothetical protein
MSTFPPLLASPEAGAGVRGVSKSAVVVFRRGAVQK